MSVLSFSILSFSLVRLSWLPFIDWCDHMWVGVAIRESIWLFPAIETVHLLALAVLLGTIVLVNLRAFGAILKRQGVSEVAGELSSWTFPALCIMLLTGVLLFLSEATKCYDSPPFHVKMIFLLLAITYHFTIYRKVIRSPETRAASLQTRLAAGLSLVLWFGVALAGRAIGYY
jgi:hypothetical protein